MSTDLKKIIKFMQRLAYDAEKIIRKHKSFKTMDKGRHDVVTEIDLMIERHCIERIKRVYPNATIVSEEYNKDNLLGKNCFVIDPIDGTKNFAHGLALWGFQIAYVENGETLASIVYLPDLNMFVSAIKDKGTFLNNKSIHINKSRDVDHSLWIVEGKPEKWHLGEMLASDSMGVRSMGCASISFIFVALGQIDGIVVYRIKNAWDILPGLFACECAGLCCKAFDNGTYIVTTNQNLLDYACEKLSKK